VLQTAAELILIRVLKALIVLLGLALLGNAAFMVVLALRARHPQEEWAVVWTHVAFRAGAGLSALWLVLGGGSVAGWLLAGLLVGQFVWAEVLRRRRPA
jgi:hypothetical protein